MSQHGIVIQKTVTWCQKETNKTKRYRYAVKLAELRVGERNNKQEEPQFASEKI
jgi:hypothetical protein